MKIKIYKNKRKGKRKNKNKRNMTKLLIDKSFRTFARKKYKNVKKFLKS